MSLDSKLFEGTEFSEISLKDSIVGITKRVFSTMVSMDIVDDFPLKDPVKKFHASITSMVGLAGTYSGIISIHCPIKLASKVTSTMLGMEVAGICEEVHDAMGELTNMLAGDIKQLFSKGGLDINLSIPTVIYGDEYSIEFAANKNSLMIPFNTKGKERFLVGLNLQKE